ncbi:hypothetical protein NL108_016431 [Boleophthalmus pectinirostris]|nr:hypothetical protein NL108_016431 [Boleophthalmus pectinirostris]
MNLQFSQFMIPPFSDGDLYVKLAANLESELKAQTWGRQEKRDGNFCHENSFSVINVEKIQCNIKDPELKSWSPSSDHSKWAITTSPGKTWTCFGDMNRAESQYLRWGGALCIDSKEVHALFEGCLNRKRPRNC